MPRIAVVVGLAGACVLGQVWPAAGQDITVTVHVEDYVRIGEQEWQRVRELVGEIFDDVAVPLRWAGPMLVPKQQWPRDGQCRVALVVANIDVPFGGDLSDTAEVLGRAAPEYSRAWVFANRVRWAAESSTVDPTLLLARAIAHEIGHLLLLDEGHSERGIMKGSLALTQVGFFRFTPEQAADMHARIRNERRAALAMK